LVFQLTKRFSRLRETAAAPENELQKASDGLVGYPEPILSEHEQRFRKSTERLITPSWYADHARPAPATNISQTTTSGYSKKFCGISNVILPFQIHVHGLRLNVNVIRVVVLWLRVVALEIWVRQ
jgi:hypothetical protein